MEREKCARCGTSEPGGGQLKPFGTHAGQVKRLCSCCARLLEEADLKGRVLPRHALFENAPDLLFSAVALVEAYRGRGPGRRVPGAIEELRRAASRCGLPRDWSRNSARRLTKREVRGAVAGGR